MPGRGSGRASFMVCVRRSQGLAGPDRRSPQNRSAVAATRNAPAARGQDGGGWARRARTTARGTPYGPRGLRASVVGHHGIAGLVLGHLPQGVPALALGEPVDVEVAVEVVRLVLQTPSEVAGAAHLD